MTAFPRASECLDENVITALVDGALDASTLSRVEAHLACCAACQGVVADAAYGAIGKTGDVSSVARRSDVALREEVEEVEGAPPNPPLAARLRPGDMLADKYCVEKILGRGGMGTVVSARHLELGNRVAIKVLHSGGAAAKTRFLREAQVYAKLGGEHIVRAFDVGRLAGGTPYLVMEYLVGEDLSRVIARGRLSIADAVQYVTEVCEALAEAHTSGVVHRDLKPANLFLTMRSGGQPFVKLLDFGVSKEIRSEQEGLGLGLTSSGTMLGSPLYMSPEQLRASKNVDARTDIWSLGVILYELLTGRTPFMAPNFPELVVAIATEPTIPPSSLCPEIPRALEDVVLRCLQKDKDDRPSSVVAIARALAPFRAWPPSATGTPRALDHAQRAPSSSRRTRSAVLALLALAGVSIALASRIGPAARAISPPATRSAQVVLSARSLPSALRPVPVRALPSPPRMSSAAPAPKWSAKSKGPTLSAPKVPQSDPTGTAD